MYVSSNWLKIVLNLKKIKLNFLKEKLMLYGFEIEETNLLKIINKNDVILNLVITTNRPDVLSIAGLTQEINNLSKFKIQKIKIKTKHIDFFKNFTINKTFSNTFQGTNAFILSEFRNIDIKSTQQWIKKRLICNNLYTGLFLQIEIFE